jgi:hypothetical protein
MSSHAALAAAKGRNFNVGAEFTVTVTVTASGETVDDVPFTTQGGQGYQMNTAFWKVSPP